MRDLPHLPAKWYRQKSDGLLHHPLPHNAARRASRINVSLLRQGERFCSPCGLLLVVYSPAHQRGNRFLFSIVGRRAGR